MKCTCKRCDGEGEIECPECNGSGEQDVELETMSEKSIRSQFQENADELIELRGDILRVKRQAKELMRLRPEKATVYERQLATVIATIEKDVEKVVESSRA